MIPGNESRRWRQGAGTPPGAEIRRAPLLHRLKFTLKEFLEERKEYRERAEEQADAAKLDPEAAAKAKEEKRAAAEVEAMLNAIMAAKDAKDADEGKK